MTMPLNTPFTEASTTDQARFNMIEQQIRPWNVLDNDILDLLAVMRREDFVPEAYRALAFVDMEVPLPQGQCMLAPRVEARLLQDLRVQPQDRVLEIGAGSGYMAALLARRAAHVVTLEIEPELAELARSNLQRAGIANVEVRQADGAQATTAGGPFDVIVLSGSVAQVPQTLLAQLKIGGRLAAVVGSEPMMYAQFITRTGEAQFQTTEPWDLVVQRLKNFPEPSRFNF
ncbi:protein-L-isoaspartate O-methyltransferase [Xylophilus sp. GW821-FHT01B05]